MQLRRVPYQEQDFARIRNFLVDTYRSVGPNGNWMIDRWNFCRYFAHAMHGTFDQWPATVGLWHDENEQIVAVVLSEGENGGEAFFQLGEAGVSPTDLEEMLDYAEEHLSCEKDHCKALEVRVSKACAGLQQPLAERGYGQTGRSEPTAALPLDRGQTVSVPSGMRLQDGRRLGDYQKAFAHGRAFGYYQGERPDDGDSERAFALLRQAPDYREEMDLAIVDAHGDIASFATAWYDAANRIGILEPVGTIPKYRRMGLGRAVIAEACNRIRAQGGRIMYVGSDQPFYLALGFAVQWQNEIWQKTWPL